MTICQIPWLLCIPMHIGSDPLQTPDLPHSLLESPLRVNPTLQK